MPAVRHVFIGTSGRTGSTLLLGMLNAHPGVHLRGENYGFVYYQYKAVEALRLSLGHLGGQAGVSPFMGADEVDVPDFERRIGETCRGFVDAGCGADTRLRGFRLAVDPGCDVADIFLRLEGETLRLGRLTVHRGDTRGFMDPSVGFDGVLRT